MRIESILDANTIAALAAQAGYIDQMGYTGKVLGKDLKNVDGTRKLDENGWRSIDIYEILKALDIPNNKYLLIRLLRRSDILALLELLDKELLLNGLMLFSKEKLMKLLTQLPMAQLVKMLLYMLPLDQLIKLLPLRELMTILRSPKLDVRTLVKGFEQMNPDFLRLLLGKLLGKPVDNLSKAEMLGCLYQFRKEQIMPYMTTLPYKALEGLTGFFCKQDSELLENISKAFIFRLFDSTQKSVLVDACHVLPEELIIRLLSQLPDQYLAMAASQIDDSTFSAYLVSQQPQLLALLAESAA